MLTVEQRFQQIMSKNVESMRLTDRRKWWSNRRKLDTQLKVRKRRAWGKMAGEKMQHEDT